MKSKLTNNRYFLECSCGCPNHLICFDIEEYDDGYLSIDLYSTMDIRKELGFFGRLRLAFSFIFKPDRYDIHGGFIIDDKNLEQLEEILKTISSKIKEPTVSLY